MGRKETLDQQPGMWGTIKTLKKESRRSGNRLFADFGHGESEALVFPTPVHRQEGDRELDYFLAMTNYGYMAIEVEVTNSGMDQDLKISDLVRARMVNGEQRFPYYDENDGYGDLGLMMKSESGGYKILIVGYTTSSRVDGGLAAWRSSSEKKPVKGMRLAPIDEGLAKQILEVNMKPVETARSLNQEAIRLARS